MKTTSVIVALLGLVISGCDPAAGIKVRSSLRPSPTRVCLDSVLAQSALLTRVDSRRLEKYDLKHGQRHYSAFFRDDTQTRAVGNLTIRTLPDSITQVTLDFVWIGRIRNVPDTDRTWMATRGTQLVSDLRAACAPRSPDVVTCDQYEVFAKNPPPCSLAT